MYNMRTKLKNFTLGFDDNNNFLMFFQCLGQAVYDLDYKSSLLDPNDMLFMTNETKIGKRGH